MWGRTRGEAGHRAGASLETLRDAALWALPAAASAGVVLHRLLPAVDAFDWLFKIALSGTVGIWTNYFAIRMLFRPRKPSVLGIHGLIPANRGRLAEAVGQAVAEELLSPEEVFGFLERNSVFEKLGDEAARAVQSGLTRPETRARIRAAAGRYLRQVTAEHIEEFLGIVLERMKEDPGSLFSFDRFWPSVRSELESQLSGGPLRDVLGALTVRLARRFAPEAASWINSQMESYIDSRGWVVRQAMRLGRMAFRLDESEIEAFVRDRTASPDFGSSVVEALDSLAPALSGLLEDPELKGAVSGWFAAKRSEAVEWLEKEGLVRGGGMVLEAMDTDRFWAALDVQVERGIHSLAGWLSAASRTRGARDRAAPLLRRLASRVPVADIVRERVDRLDLDELERLVYRVTSENLHGIEFLGGVLGCLAGIALVWNWAALPMGIAAVAVWVAGRRGDGGPDEAR